jgi:hypothetical protein
MSHEEALMLIETVASRLLNGGWEQWYETTSAGASRTTVGLGLALGSNSKNLPPSVSIIVMLV